MARELNRELFNNRTTVDADPAPNGVNNANFAKAEDVKLLRLNFEAMTKRMKEFESRVETLNSRVEELVTQNKTRFERVQNHFQRQGEMLQNSQGEVHNKIAQVVSRLNERKISENIVKEMVDRHTNVVQAFEIRLGQLQKVMSEQEMQLMHARSELKDALLQLSRMKK